jgi:hypothetical protein
VRDALLLGDNRVGALGARALASALPLSLTLRELDLGGNAGVGPSIPDGEVIWMVRVGVALLIDENIGVEFGYRLFDFDLVDGPSEVDAGLRGLFGGASQRVVAPATRMIPIHSDLGARATLLALGLAKVKQLHRPVPPRLSCTLVAYMLPDCTCQQVRSRHRGLLVCTPERPCKRALLSLAGHLCEEQNG